MAKKMAEVAISHNDIGEKDRGTWRKYNPYNPYVDDKEEDKEKKQDLKVESLDDLFEDEPEDIKPKEENKEANINVNNENKNKEKIKNNSIKEEVKPLDLEEFNEAPILPQEPEEDDSYDLQKELEAKFDELFGPMDET